MQVNRIKLVIKEGRNMEKTQATTIEHSDREIDNTEENLEFQDDKTEENDKSNHIQYEQEYKSQTRGVTSTE